MRRRVPILFKLLGAYLVPAVATFVGFGFYAHYSAQRALEEELGRRLTSVASAVALDVAGENLALLQPGDESTRTYRNIARRLGDLAMDTQVARIYLFDKEGHSLGDTRAGIPIGEHYYALDANRSELDTVFAGRPASSILFRGLDGKYYKSGFAPIRDPDEPAGKVAFAVGVDGAAAMYDQLATFRRTLLGLGGAGTLLVVILSVLMARLLVRPLNRLSRAAERIGRGELDAPVLEESRDEVGLVAHTMEEMRRGLRSRDERMQMMLAGIAHEVRNPLGGLQLYAGILRDELTGDEEKLAHVHRIERELDHLKIIVEEFLEYARRGKPQLVDTNLADLLEEVHGLALPLARERDVSLTLTRTPGMARADAGQLRRALLNLTQNAVQACASGKGRVALACSSDGKGAHISISDNGEGMSAEMLTKIWTPFFTTRQKGTGLGLAFVREIAQDHGADLDVKSHVGEGTTFELTFPCIG